MSATTGRGFLRDNGLTLAFGAGFLLTLVGQAIAGHAELNSVLKAQSLHPLSFVDYLFTSDFMVDVTENWQSEFLQFSLYIMGTVWLVQRGSPESKSLDKVGTESDEEQLVATYARFDSPRWAAAGGWRRAVYSRSLGLVMSLIFVLSWLAQSVTGTIAFNEEQLRQLQDPVGWPVYVTSAEFWNRTLQNWQSELLAVTAMVILSVYLRQRGSPESKPVGAAHAATGVEG
ncbi:MULTISPECIES: DUF6766 family protein [Streptomyces]|uniref:DUF6766 family protein n=1 Tax=Streptomyces noboritoensis TaxID=67337 RepID=A0ABV6TGW0_9ACTN|nr:DUF6766 family protein [Streptomyces melanogenes]